MESGSEMPYATPQAIQEHPPDEVRICGKERSLAVIGFIFMLSPGLGTLLTIHYMIRAFNTLAQSGAADPVALADEISSVVLISLYSTIVGLIGVVLVSIVLFRGINQERWFFVVGIIIGILWLFLSIPFTTVFGIYLLIAFLMRKSQFRSNQHSPLLNLQS